MYAINENGGIRAVGSEDDLEIGEIFCEVLPVQTPNSRDTILAKIQELEATVTSRRVREALISGDTSYIKSVDVEVSKLRLQL